MACVNPCNDSYPVWPFALSGPWGPIGYGGGMWGPLPARSSMPPSPIAPWDRDPVSSAYEVISAIGNISLTVGTTFLSKPINTPPAPIAVVLPNGTFVKQVKQIFIRGDHVAGTETFIVAGAFAGGFGHLQFDTLGSAAVLLWDGSTWNLVGGNATLQT